MLDDVGGLRALARRHEGLIASAAEASASTTWPRTRRRTRKTVSLAGLMVDRVPARGVDADLRRSLAALPRLLLRAEHARLRLGGAARAVQAARWRTSAHRSDLNYVIGEMISELTVQHAYIDGGDYPDSAAPRGRAAGRRFELDTAAGRYKIAKIFAGQNEETIYRSPLTEVGVDAKVGDYVLAIDGEELHRRTTIRTACCATRPTPGRR